MKLRAAAALGLSGALLFSLPAASAPGDPPVFPERKATEERPPQEAFTDEITVALSTVVVRAVDTWGRPILGLQPKDFRVRAGKREIRPGQSNQLALLRRLAPNFINRQLWKASRELVPASGA